MSSIPKIRFKGFTDDWEKRKLGDFGKATGGTSIESEFSEDGIYKVISIGSYSESSIYNDQGIRAIKSDKTSNRVLNKNDLTMILNDKTISGNIIGRVLLIEESGVYVYNQRTERIEINVDEYDPIFLYEMLNAPNIREKIIKQAQGNTQIYVNWSTISLLAYMIPLREEQVKIGESLHSISNLITLQQQKCKDIKLLKKYVLQKMFPQKGRKVPEIRFKEYAEDWEQRKLEDVLEVLKDGTHGTHADVDNGVYLLSAKNIKNGCVSIDENDRQISVEEYEKIHIKFKLKNGDVLMTIVGTIGESAVLESAENITFQRSVAFLRPNNELLNSFLFQTIYTKSFQKELDNRKATGAQPGIYLGEVAQIPIMIPTNISEQAKISSCLTNLDHLIALHQRKCNELKELKKYMLQNMFPQKG